MSKNKKSVLRAARIVLAFISILCLSALFVNTSGKGVFSFLASAQFIPAILSANFVLLAVIVLVTFLFGRVYCSVICPLGITQDFINWLTKKFGGKKAVSRFGYKKPHTILRYAILVVYAVFLVLGTGFAMALLDPYSAFGRIVTDIFQPAVIGFNNLLAKISPDAFGREPFVYVNSLTLAVAVVTFVVVAWMSVRKGRLYCNSICPVGSVLGLVSRFSVFKPVINQDECVNCGVCAKKCKASCIDPSEHKIDYSRCVDCFDCIENCSVGAIRFTAKKTEMKAESDTSLHDEGNRRREFLSSIALLGIAGTKMMAEDISGKVEPDLSAYKRKTAVSPFGSESHEHLNRNCTACHLCISKCPNKVLRPAVNEYGIDGMMQPVMDFSRGYCDYDCTLCGEVCPNDAIKPLTLDEKQSTSVGLAVFYKDICVVNKDGVSCGNCEAHCPTGAIKLVTDYNDPQKRVYPKVESALCIGCGACEYHCPAQPVKAIHVEGLLIHK